MWRRSQTREDWRLDAVWSSARNAVSLFARDERGADLFEYVVLIGFIAGCIIVLGNLTNNLLGFFQSLAGVVEAKLP